MLSSFKVIKGLLEPDKLLTLIDFINTVSLTAGDNIVKVSALVIVLP
jgi:hypothetical protein